MADVAVTPTALAINVASADILDADGTAIADTADTFSITAGGQAGQHLLLKFFDDGTGCDVVIKAGDRPPSQRAGLGDLTITMAASDCKYIVIETGRFLQNDGTIRVTATDAGLECKAFTLPDQ